jgi:hypothetical protein
LSAILSPGVYKRFDPLGRTTRVVADVSQPEADFPKAEIYVRENPRLCEGHLELVVIGAHEVGLVSKDGKLAAILAPGSRQVYWKGPVQVAVERIAIDVDNQVPERVLRALQAPVSPSLLREAQAAIVLEEVPQSAVGLLYVSGKLERALAPGVHGFWKFQRSVQVDVVDTRLSAMEVSGQEILTRDKGASERFPARRVRSVGLCAKADAAGRGGATLKASNAGAEAHRANPSGWRQFRPATSLSALAVAPPRPAALA